MTSPMPMIGKNFLTEPAVRTATEKLLVLYANETSKVPPCGCKQVFTIVGWIMHLNDMHSWTYTQIADWLDAERLPGIGE